MMTEGPCTATAEEAARAILESHSSESRGIYCVLGPNGSGKSRFLQLLEKLCKQERRQCYLLRSNRSADNLGAIFQRGAVQYSPAPDGDIGRKVALDLVNGTSLISSKYPAPPAFRDAMGIMIMMLHTEQELDHQRYRDVIADWVLAGQAGEKPRPKENRLADFLRAIGKIVGREISLTKGDRASATQQGVVASNGIAEFPIDGLSDGEKQVFLLCIFFVLQKDDKIIFLIDEPELHLNEKRAVEFWDLLESTLPSATFVYATHSAVFATREETSATWTIGPNDELEPIDLGAPVNSATLSEIVGERVSLLRTSKPPIFCEDELHNMILSDVLAGEDVFPVTLRNCKTVIDAVRREEGWDLLRPRAGKSCGLIDRDGRSSEQVAQLEKGAVLVFPFDESESLLVHPKIVSFWVSNGGDEEGQERLNPIIVSCAREIMPNAIRRIKNTLQSKATCSIDYELTSSGLSHVDVRFDNDIAEQFQREADALLNAVTQADIVQILRLFPGKELYARLAAHMRAQEVPKYDKDAARQYRALRRTVGFVEVLNEICEIKELREKIRAKLSLCPEILTVVDPEPGP